MIQLFPKPEVEQEVGNRIFTIPNLMTLARAICAMQVFNSLQSEDFETATIYFFVGAITDVDGSVAKLIDKFWETWGSSKLGKIIDPIADKMLFISLSPLNYEIFAIGFFLEAVTLRFSLSVRNNVGDHVIANGSKFATAVQFTVGILIFLWPGSPFAQTDAFWLIVSMSGVRLVSYYLLWKKEVKDVVKKITKEVA